MNGDKIICPNCGAKMILKNTQKFFYKNGEPRKFYGCSRFPLCTSTHGAHPDGRPLGIPVTQKIKTLRVKVHFMCNQVWGNWNDIDSRVKREMYNWMKENAPKTHIGEMNEEELLKTEELLKNILKEKKENVF
jgi:ssDNA-binding Zn-finger/Zn-ribbon topoisomerase 1